MMSVGRVLARAPRLSLLSVFVLLAPLALAEGFYEAIQRDAERPLSVREFRSLEKGARRDHLNPEVYAKLARVFGETSERVWALVYGEVYCLLETSPEGRAEMARRLVGWYAASFEKRGDEVRLAFYREARSRRGVPIEARYEQAALHAAMPLILAERVHPLTLAKLVKIRERQLERWFAKGYPENALIRHQRRILEAGHHEAYGYWLLGAAAPGELDAWRRDHPEAWRAWLAWQSENPFEPESPDFHRRRNGA